MKFEFDFGSSAVGAAMLATPTELDGFPLIDKLAVSASVKELSPDRSTVAAVLAFAPYLSGQQLFPAQFSSLTAELCQRLLNPGWTHYTPLHPSNLPIPRGRRDVFLGASGSGGADLPELRLVPACGETGVRYEPNSMIVSTNAIDMDSLGIYSPRHPSRARLAAALLLAEDLDVATYVVSRRTADSMQLNESVMDLLNAVGIGIRVEDV